MKSQDFHRKSCLDSPISPVRVRLFLMKTLTILLAPILLVVLIFPTYAGAETYACVLNTEAHVSSEGVNRFHPRYENFTPEKLVLVEYEKNILTFKGRDHHRIPMPTFKNEYDPNAYNEDGGLFVDRSIAPVVIRAFLDKQTKKLDTLIYFFSNYNMLSGEKMRWSVVQYWTCND